MHTNPQLSVVIVNWKSIDYLLPCIASLKANNLTEDQIVVVDNNSGDGCGVKLAQRYPQVKFIQATQNLGFAAANNIGANYTRSDWILFLNPDTLMPVGALAALLATATSSRSTAIVGARLVSLDGTPQLSSTLSPPSAISQLLSTSFIVRLRQRKIWQSTKPVEVAAVSGACLLIRRGVFLFLRGWDERYKMYVEDVDLCTSARKAGWKVLHAPVRVFHHGGKSSDQKELGWKSRQMCESRDLYLHKHRTCLAAWSARVCVLLVGLARSLKGNRQAKSTIQWALGR